MPSSCTPAVRACTSWWTWALVIRRIGAIPKSTATKTITQCVANRETPSKSRGGSRRRRKTPPSSGTPRDLWSYERASRRQRRTSPGPCLFESRIASITGFEIQCLYLHSQRLDDAAITPSVQRGVFQHLSGGQRDVLEPQLATGDLLAVLAAGDDHLPELLAPALHDRFGEHVDPSLLHRAQEIGAVAHPHGELSSLLDRCRSPYAGRALDGRGVDAAVHHTPGRMVVLAELDRASNLAPANLFEVKSGNAYELAGGYFRVYVGHGHTS